MTYFIGRLGLCEVIGEIIHQRNKYTLCKVYDYELHYLCTPYVVFLTSTIHIYDTIDHIYQSPVSYINSYI